MVRGRIHAVEAHRVGVHAGPYPLNGLAGACGAAAPVVAEAHVAAHVQLLGGGRGGGNAQAQAAAHRGVARHFELLAGGGAGADAHVAAAGNGEAAGAAVAHQGIGPQIELLGGSVIAQVVAGLRGQVHEVAGIEHGSRHGANGGQRELPGAGAVVGIGVGDGRAARGRHVRRAAAAGPGVDGLVHAGVAALPQ